MTDEPEEPDEAEDEANLPKTPSGPGLSEQLDSLRPPDGLVLPSFDILLRTTQRVRDHFDSIGEKPITDPERLLREMRRRIATRDWSKVPMSFATRAARAAFEKPLRHAPDAAFAQSFILDEIRASTRQGFLGPMLRIYIATFESGAGHTITLAAALQQVRARISGRWHTLLTEVPELFLPDRVAPALATRMAAMDDPWNGLRKLGLRPHEPGLMDSVHLAFVAQIAPQLADPIQVERLLNWLRPAGQPARQVGASEAIDALLRPWENRDPGQDLKMLLIDRLTELYGHPRVNRNPAWNGVDPALQAMLLRWISGADIRFLFRVLTEAERGHMWEEREAFWWTLYQQGRIDEVWVAFNTEGHRTAMQKLPPESRQSGSRFGKQTGEKDKSLLIMRIGQKIVVEGTFNFKVHIFDANARNAPKLYQPRYDVSEIRHLSGSETKAHLGGWQRWVMWNLS